MLLIEVVEVSARVTATPARSAKIAALADLLRRLAPDEVEPAVGFLVGEPRQGRIGVGWATLAKAVAARRSGPLGVGGSDRSGHGSVPERAPIRARNGEGSEGITIGELDRALTQLAGT